MAKNKVVLNPEQVDMMLRSLHLVFVWSEDPDVRLNAERAATVLGKTLPLADFKMPDAEAPTHADLQRYVRDRLDFTGDEGWCEALAAILVGTSFAEVERVTMSIKRSSIVRGESVEVQLATLVQRRIGELSREDRLRVAKSLVDAGLSQRKVHDITGVSRDTIRKHSIQEGA